MTKFIIDTDEVPSEVEADTHEEALDYACEFIGATNVIDDEED